MIVVGTMVLVIIGSGLLLALKAGALGVDDDLLRHEHEEQMHILHSASFKSHKRDGESATANTLETSL